MRLYNVKVIDNRNENVVWKPNSNNKVLWVQPINHSKPLPVSLRWFDDIILSPDILNSHIGTWGLGYRIWF